MQSQTKHGAPLFLKATKREKFPCIVLAPQCPNGQQWVDMPWSGDAGKRPAQPSAAMQLALDAMGRLAFQYPQLQKAVRATIDQFKAGDISGTQLTKAYHDLAKSVRTVGDGHTAVANPVAKTATELKGAKKAAKPGPKGAKTNKAAKGSKPAKGAAAQKS